MSSRTGLWLVCVFIVFTNMLSLRDNLEKVSLKVEYNPVKY